MMSQPQQPRQNQARRKRILVTVGILLSVVVLIYLAFIVQGVLNA